MTTETPQQTNTRVFEILDEIRIDLGTVKTDVAVIKSSSHADRLNDHEKRIRNVESRMWAAVGIAGLLAAVSPYLSRILIP